MADKQEKPLVPMDSVIYQIMPQFQRIAQKGQRVRWEEESQYALQACKSNPSLLKCDAASVQDAIINVASVGLSLNPASGYAYLVPEYNKKARQPTCQLRVSFKGLIKLATDTGSISWVKADVVKSEDEFRYHGIDKLPTHNMNPFSDRGETVGAYCVAKTTDGDLLVDIISRAELDTIRACAKTQNVWEQWFDEMAKKAIIKRAAKQWPPGKKTEQLHEAIKVINEAEGTDFEEFEHLEKVAAQIIEHIENNDQLGVGEVWCECTERQMEQLWRAITKGGYFTQEQKAYIRTAAQAYKAANDEETEENKEPTE